MVDPSWIEGMGTPLADRIVIHELRPAILLKYMGEKWNVTDLSDLQIDTYTFSTLEDIRNTIEGEVVYQSEETLLITQSTHSEAIRLCRAYFDHSEKIRTLETQQQNIIRFNFQMIGVEQLIPSLLEPFPAEVMINFVLDSLSEIFICSLACYKHSFDNYTKIGQFGAFSFPDTLKMDRTLYPGEMLRKDGTHYLSFEDEEGKSYILSFIREEGFSNEEVSLLKALTSLLQKSRQLIKEQIKNSEIRMIVNQFAYVMEMISNFSKEVLTSTSIEDLKKRIADALRELFQAEYILIYEKISMIDMYNLEYTLSLTEYSFPEKLPFYENQSTLEGFNISYEKYYHVKAPQGEPYLIIIGKSVSDQYVLSDVMENVDRIIPEEISRAIANAKAFITIEDQKLYMEKIAEDITYLSDNILDFETMHTAGDLMESIGFFTRNTTNFEISRTYLYEHIEGDNIIRIDHSGSILGSVRYIKNRELDMRDQYLLSYLSKILLLSEEKIRLINNAQSIISFDELIIHYLKMKYRMSGLGGDIRIYRLPVCEDDSVFEGLAVGIRTKEALYIATFLEEDDIKKLLPTQ